LSDLMFVQHAYHLSSLGGIFGEGVSEAYDIRSSVPEFRSLG